MKKILLLFILLWSCSSPDNPVGCFLAINQEGNVINYGRGDLRTWEKFKMFPAYDTALPDGYVHYEFDTTCK